VTKISAQELAELVPCSLDYVRRLRELGILESEDGDGLFPWSAVHLVRLMAAFEEAGIALEDVARGVAAGALSFPLGLFLPEPAELSTTYEELGADLGRSPDLLRRLSRELGLPPVPDSRVRTEDAEILTLIVSKLDLADDDELSRFARLYGGAVQRMVASGLQSSTERFASASRRSTSRIKRRTASSTRRRRASPSSFAPSSRGCRDATGSTPSSSISSR
jgi:hypothetical protein